MSKRKMPHAAYIAANADFVLSSSFMAETTLEVTN
jgi:hypothetical protein